MEDRALIDAPIMLTYRKMKIPSIFRLLPPNSVFLCLQEMSSCLLKNTQAWGKKQEDDFHVRWQASVPLLCHKPCHEGKASSGEQLLAQVFTQTLFTLFFWSISHSHSPAICLPGSSICLSPFSFLLNHSDSILLYLLYSYIHCTSSSENIYKFSNQTNSI